MYRSVISNLIGSICSPHLQSVSVKLESLAEEVEHFPWGVVNSLTKVSPYTLQKVEIALYLLEEDWDFSTLDIPSEYERLFRQVRLALPELDKKLIIAVRHPSRLFANLTSPQNRIFLMWWYVTYMEFDHKGTTNTVPVVVSSRVNQVRLPHQL